MTLPFSGKVIAITGAGSGIGQATALKLASLGATLALADLNSTALTSTLESLESQQQQTSSSGDPGTKPQKHSSTVLDVTNSTAVNDWITNTIDRFSHLDGAANIAGVDTSPGTTPYGNIVDMTDDHWRFMHSVNLDGLFYCLRAELRVMTKGASVVNAASTAGLRGAASFAAYCSSKHAVVGLTKAAAKEAGPKGVRVNAVCPGPIDTPLLKRLTDSNEGLMDKLIQNATLQRLGKVEEIANAFCYLLSDESSWSNGTTMTVDGGAMGA